MEVEATSQGLQAASTSNQILPYSLQKEHNPAYTLILAP